MNRDHVVRPRWIWSGVVLVLLGGCGLAVWVATWRPAAGVAGAVLLLLGGAAVLRGGILYDTHGLGPVTVEIDDARGGHPRPGTAPGDMVSEDRLRDEARDSTRMTDRLLHAAEASPRPPLDRVAGGLLLVAAVFLLVIQGLYPHTHAGQDNATRSLLLAVVTAFAALRILLGQRPGPAASALAGLVGIALILCALLTDHDRSATVVLEVVTGAWIVVAAVLSLDHLRDRPGDQPRGRPATLVRPAGSPGRPAADDAVITVRRKKSGLADRPGRAGLLAGAAVALGAVFVWRRHGSHRTNG